MATFIDERPEDDNEDFTNIEGVSEEITEEAPTQQEYVEAEPEVAEEADDLPDKYKGKTPAEIAKMHQEAEKLLGRQSSEVGELRKIVDDFVKTQLATQETATKKVEEDDEVDFFVDPQKAVQRAIDNHPKLREAEQVSTDMKKAKALAELQALHPDYGDVIGNAEFGEWVAKSKVRLKLFEQADQGYDTDAADELISTWKERQQYTQNIVANEKQERKRQVKSASTGSAQGSGEAPSRKIYRRSDIIKLMQRDPDRYMQMADEISLAYAEGRVK